MNKTFYGHTPNENGLLDLDRVIHIFIILKPRDAKLIMMVQLICGTAFRSYCVKHMKKIHADGILESLDY